MNRVNLCGRITKEVELRNAGEHVLCSFTLAVDRGTKDQNGNKQADFINCVAFDTRANFISKYAKKGNMLGVDGRLQSRTYSDKNGNTQYVLEVVVDNVENYASKNDNTAQPTQVEKPEPNNFTPVQDDDLPF